MYGIIGFWWAFCAVGDYLCDFCFVWCGVSRSSMFVDSWLSARTLGSAVGGVR